MVLPSAPPRPCQNTTVLAPLPMAATAGVGSGVGSPAADAAVGAASAGAAVGASAAGAAVAASAGAAVAAAAAGAAVGAASAAGAVGAAAGVVAPPQAASVTPAAPNAIAFIASRRFKGSVRLVSGSVVMLGPPDGCGCAARAGHNALKASALQLCRPIYLPNLESDHHLLSSYTT